MSMHMLVGSCSRICACVHRQIPGSGAELAVAVAATAAGAAAAAASPATLVGVADDVAEAAAAAALPLGSLSPLAMASADTSREACTLFIVKQGFAHGVERR